MLPDKHVQQPPRAGAQTSIRGLLTQGGVIVDEIPQRPIAFGGLRGLAFATRPGPVPALALSLAALPFLVEIADHR
jgi:hypothetical protein